MGPHIGVNGYTTYVFAPDGSKEGWDSSEQGDNCRNMFIDIFQSLEYPKIIEFTFGGDDDGIGVSFTDYNKYYNIERWDR